MGNATDLCYRQKWQGYVKHNRLSTGCPRSMGLLAGICWTKSQSFRCSSGIGVVITNDWCIVKIYYDLYDSKNDNLQIRLPKKEILGTRR